MGTFITRNTPASPVSSWLAKQPELQSALQAAQLARQMQDRLDLCFLPWVPAGSLRLNHLADGQLTLYAHSPALIAKLRNNEASLIRSLVQCGLNVSKIRFRVQASASRVAPAASPKPAKRELSETGRQALADLKTLTRASRSDQE